MTPAAYFSRDLYRFLAELKKHNQRDWFLRNKARYEKEVRDPMLRLIADLRPRLAKISPHFVADPSPTGGSMMRIYRDIRFSKDKSPYKTWIAAHFWHAHGEGELTPAYYLHLAPGRTFAGGGLWRPSPEGVHLIRTAIVDRTSAWKKAVAGRMFGTGCGMAGESLKRPPSGFDPAHPFIDDLKRKDFAMSIDLQDADLLRKDPIAPVVEAFQSITPFMRFLTDALRLPF